MQGRKLKGQQQETVSVVQKNSTVSEWENKVEKTFQLSLPSGASILVRKLGLLDLAITGYIPFNLIASTVKTAQAMGSSEKWETISKEELSDIVTMLDKAILRSVIEPVVSETGENGTMNVSKIPFADKFFIFSKAIDTSGVEILKPFRGE